MAAPARRTNMSQKIGTRKREQGRWGAHHILRIRKHERETEPVVEREPHVDGGVALVRHEACVPCDLAALADETTELGRRERQGLTSAHPRVQEAQIDVVAHQLDGKPPVQGLHLGVHEAIVRHERHDLGGPVVELGAAELPTGEGAGVSTEARAYAGVPRQSDKNSKKRGR